MESSPHGPECDQTNFTEFKQELLSMFSTWRVEQSGTLSKLVADVAALKTQCSEIHKSNLEIEASITFINVQFEEMKERITKLEIERNQNRDCLISLEKQLEELKQLSRSSSIEVRNVPDKDKEVESDLVNIIQTIGTTFDVRLQEHDIRDIYRRPGKPGTTKTIVAEFNSVQMKNKFLDSSRRFNRSHQGPEKLNCEHIGLVGNKRQIYVDEHLPYSIRKLLYHSREFARKNDFKFCWSQMDGCCSAKILTQNFFTLKPNCVLLLCLSSHLLSTFNQHYTVFTIHLVSRLAIQSINTQVQNTQPHNIQSQNLKLQNTLNTHNKITFNSVHYVTFLFKSLVSASLSFGVYNHHKWQI
jgi:hypothetical protein